MPAVKNKKTVKRKTGVSRESRPSLFSFRLAHPRHSFKLLPKHHTSYPLLGLILILSGIFSVGWTVYAFGDVNGGQYKVNATVPADPLTDPAIILSPSDGAVLKSAPITLSGSCPLNSYVKLYHNEVFDGATMCQPDGTWSIGVQLSLGKNLFVAQDYNVTDQAGPSSPPITVTYSPNPDQSVTSGAAAGTPRPSSAPPLVISSDFKYYGVFAGQRFQQSIIISGGKAPYAISIDWGDGNSDLLSQVAPGSITAEHTYAYPGSYRHSYNIRITATDTERQIDVMQTLAIVAPATPGSGDTGIGNGGGSVGSRPGNQRSLLSQLEAWILPTYVVALVALCSFWLGERRELEVLQLRASRSRPRRAH